MKLVTFARAQAPHGVGDTRLVPDAVAARLEADGVLAASETWPAREPGSPAAQKPKRPVVRPERPHVAPDQRIAREDA